MTAASLAPTVDPATELADRLFAQPIRAKCDALSFILFGSHARGEQHPHFSSSPQDCREQVSAAMPPATDRPLMSVGSGTTIRSVNRANRRIARKYSEVDHD
jgi:hypothetical protein